jgi:hypothetical protein
MNCTPGWWIVDGQDGSFASDVAVARIGCVRGTGDGGLCARAPRSYETPEFWRSLLAVQRLHHTGS